MLQKNDEQRIKPHSHDQNMMLFSLQIASESASIQIS